MRTRDEILKRLDWLENLLSDENMQGHDQQTKIWAQLDALNWVLTDRRLEE